MGHRFSKTATNVEHHLLNQHQPQQYTHNSVYNPTTTTLAAAAATASAATATTTSLAHERTNQSGVSVAQQRSMSSAGGSGSIGGAGVGAVDAVGSDTSGSSSPTHIIIKIHFSQMEQQQRQLEQLQAQAQQQQQHTLDANANIGGSSSSSTTAAVDGAGALLDGVQLRQALVPTTSRTAGSTTLAQYQNILTPTNVATTATTTNNNNNNNMNNNNNQAIQSTSAAADVVEYCEVLSSDAFGGDAEAKTLLRADSATERRRNCATAHSSSTPDKKSTCSKSNNNNNNGIVSGSGSKSSTTTSSTRRSKDQSTFRKALNGIWEPSSKSSRSSKEHKSSKSSSSNTKHSKQNTNTNNASTSSAARPQSLSVPHQSPALPPRTVGGGALGSGGGSNARHSIASFMTNTSTANAAQQQQQEAQQPLVLATPAQIAHLTHMAQMTLRPTSAMGGTTAATQPQMVIPLNLLVPSNIRCDIQVMAAEMAGGSATTTATATATATTANGNHQLMQTTMQGMSGMPGVVTPPNGPIIHSQADFVHYLVPDLERITNTSYYWGKIDRYEAERLLEGKPEGTFLLRDSAQEEFLFSVTFRKYGRSLHARIEQRGHKFSFDCHDPGVFNSDTVIGLIKHYVDPAFVMFFEPLLTFPLHRKNTFSLQQLCRATIASHITYDGINELELPGRLKSYLKEYHYKQKLRVSRVATEFYAPCT